MLRRLFSAQPQRLSSILWKHHPTLLDTSHDPSFPITDLYLFPNFLSPPQQSTLISKCDRLLRKLPFETSHFDHVITSYREMQTRKLHGLEKCLETLDAINRERGEEACQWKPFHILELDEKKGSIGAHVDHVDV